MVSLFALLGAACGSSAPISIMDSGPPVDATQENGNDAQTIMFDPRCWDPTRGITTVPDKTCTTGNDCKSVTEVSCGFSKVFAVAKTAVCEPYPAPPCVALPDDTTPPYYWLVETGEMTENVDAIALRCLAGKCQTYVTP
jgi:hypothetical protein